jgi:hypothetical protein
MVTSVPIIPEDLDQWNLKVLDSLLKIGRIESETFDFKGPDFKELNVDICAMANTSTGIIVLGISPEKNLVDVRRQGYHICLSDDTTFLVQSSPTLLLSPPPLLSLSAVELLSDVGLLSGAGLLSSEELPLSIIFIS